MLFRSGTVITYAAYNRLVTNKAPSLLCTHTNDIFKTPVGLITADEVSMGGMVYNSPTNTNSYLYTDMPYWTMTPSDVDGYDYITVHAVIYGYLKSGNLHNADAYGIRPVINLKANTKFVSGNGEASTPLVVKGT